MDDRAPSTGSNSTQIYTASSWSPGQWQPLDHCPSSGWYRYLVVDSHALSSLEPMGQTRYRYQLCGNFYDISFTSIKKKDPPWGSILYSRHNRHLTCGERQGQRSRLLLNWRSKNYNLSYTGLIQVHQYFDIFNELQVYRSTDPVIITITKYLQYKLTWVWLLYSYYRSITHIWSLMTFFWWPNDIFMPVNEQRCIKWNKANKMWSMIAK